MDLNGHVVTNIYVKSEFSPKSIVAKLSDIADYVGGGYDFGSGGCISHDNAAN